MKYILTENQVKNLIKKKLGIDLTGKIFIVTNKWELPFEFDRVIPTRQLNHLLNRFGPMYVIEGKKRKYLVQPRDNGYDGWGIGENIEYGISEPSIMRDLGIHPLGLQLDDLINAYIEE